jgi:CBS domain containing-hemolysin-like protein
MPTEPPRPPRKPMITPSKDRDDRPAPAASQAPSLATTGGGWLTALRTRLGLSPGAGLRETIEDALKESVTNGTEASAFSVAEREMLQRTLRFGTLKVEDVMVPRSDITAVDESESLHVLLQTFDEAGVSRIPVFNETLDDPRGMVHIKDLLRWLMGDASGRPAIEGRAPTPQARLLAGSIATAVSQLNLGKADLAKPISSTKLKRAVLYVPASMAATNLLIRMQTRRIHMALVVDEYGGTDGLVTIEDLVEQIVGDIEDEHDEVEAANIVADASGAITAAARTPVKELEERLDVKLLSPEQEEEIDTLGGLVFALVGHVPARGELVLHPSGLEFEVLDADPRRVKRLKVHKAGKLRNALLAGTTKSS